MGALNFKPPDAPFPAYLDVDLNIVLEGGREWVVHDLFYKGRMLECGHVGAEAYRLPESILANPSLAPNVAAKGILSDPLGFLTDLAETVADEYPRRRWVLVRCDVAKDSARQSIDGLCQTTSPTGAVLHLGTLVLNLSGLVAIADLTPPTHRRSLVRMKKVLEPWGQADLQEEALRVYGFAQFSRAMAESYLEDCAAIFDRAVEVTRTPIRFGAKLKPHVRPYVVEGAKEMIVEGHRREAMCWIAAMLWISNTAIQIDAPDDEKARYQARLERLLSDMGMSTEADVRSRIQSVGGLIDNVFGVADDIVRRHPQILD